MTHKFNVGGHEGYITVGLYKDGMPGEIFITMAKEGSTVSGLMDSFACAISIALQHGVPLKLLCEKFAHTRFEPSGWTPESRRSATPSRSWITSSAGCDLRFLTGQQQALFDDLRPKNFGPVGSPEQGGQKSFGDFVENAPAVTDNRQLTTDNLRADNRVSVHAADALKELIDMGDAPTCSTCGAIMTRNGSCYRCMSCGSTSGCS